MRGDRRSARLTASVRWGLLAALALSAGIASIWIPASRGAVVPSILELIVGWVLLIASLLLTNRTLSTSALLGLAGLTWIAVGLAPFAGSPGNLMLPRLALVPTALVALAAIVGPGGRLRIGLPAFLAASVVGATIVAGAGWYRFSVLIIGLLTVASALPVRASTKLAGSDRVRLGFGGGLIAAGAVAVNVGATSPQFVANLHDLVMIGGAAALTMFASRDPGLARSGGIDLDEPSALATSLSVALRCGPLSIAFPGLNGTWLDPSGRAHIPPSPGGPVESESGQTIAWLSPPIILDPESASTVRHLLRTASDTANLRSALRIRVAEIDRSRERLQTAAEGERARLIVLLESGPLAALARSGALLTMSPSGRTLTARVAVAERVLRDVVHGLHPIAASGGLIAAIEKLAADSHASHIIEADIDLGTDLGIDLGPSESEVVWFTCAEGLANAAKHAPGSSVNVGLRRFGPTLELTVSDNGRGGADVAGSGLSGLRERALNVGGNLTVRSRAGRGTTLRLVVPLRSEIERCHVPDAASTPIRTPIASRTVDA